MLHRVRRSTLALGACALLLADAVAGADSTRGGSFVDVQGTKLYYDECGSGQEVVILIHGAAMHCAPCPRLQAIILRLARRSLTIVVG
jgi:hypothetical protein